MVCVNSLVHLLSSGNVSIGNRCCIIHSYQWIRTRKKAAKVSISAGDSQHSARI